KPRRFPPQKRIGPPRGGARALPNHHRALRCLPGTVAQCPCRLPAAAAPRPSDCRRRGSLSRHQDPRPPDYPPPRSPLAWRQSSRRLDRQTNPPRRSYQLPPLRQGLRPEPTPLRPAQAQGPRLVAARWLPLRLPPHTQRGPSGAALPVLPQAALRPARQQPLPSPPRQSHPTDRRPACRLTPSDCSTLLVYDFPGYNLVSPSLARLGHPPRKLYPPA